ncbi:MAG: UV DNA damage repair endonuclease UvsE [Gemmatimonadaceae bacterium]|nr:UV DNA damage repair endonuclease UvsE [Gemmatimonadaceae bacterium]
MPPRPTAPALSGIRWGLCCQFTDASPRFRQATATYVLRLSVEDRQQYLADVVGANAIALLHAIERCAELGIGAFRISSQFVPLATHPTVGFVVEDLPNAPAILRAYAAARALAALRDIRLSFHPDQFVVLGSARPDVVDSSVREMDHHGRIASLIGADTICLHGGGLVGGAEAAGARLLEGIERLSEAARSRLALENDDRVWAPVALLPLCDRAGVPFIYDAHHHRCLPDGAGVAEVTAASIATWERVGKEPYFHLSSPRDGWAARDPRPHADYIDPADVPDAWRDVRATVDLEAKAKERAISHLPACQ